ncbi:MAG: IS66 family insertion sequence element accessory protein TnpB [Bacterioplanes sp.]|nr:IS66 family insertion sequence element accessory protein TnpB [Bacterioplanes sp.]
MLRPERTAQAYLYTGVVDMRKSIDGLALLVESTMTLNLMQPARCYWRRMQRTAGHHTGQNPGTGSCTQKIRLPSV